MPTAVLFENVNYGGRSHSVTADAASLPPPLDANASSANGPGGSNENRTIYRANGQITVGEH